MAHWQRDHQAEQVLVGLWRDAGWDDSDGSTAPKIFRSGDMMVMVSRDNVHLGVAPDLRWHISISTPNRLPSWPEFVDAVHILRPGVMFCVPMPPPQFWINIHPNTLHVWEVKDDNLTAQWREEGRHGQSPS